MHVSVLCTTKKKLLEGGEIKGDKAQLLLVAQSTCMTQTLIQSGHDFDAKKHSLFCLLCSFHFLIIEFYLFNDI